jgi:hypothetical protein
MVVICVGKQLQVNTTCRLGEVNRYALSTGNLVKGNMLNEVNTSAHLYETGAAKCGLNIGGNGKDKLRCG